MNKRAIISISILIALLALSLSFSANAQTAPVAVTYPASAVSKTSVFLNGMVNTGGAYVTNVWFEYGPTQSFGNRVGLQSINNGGYISAVLTGLQVNVTYYFRIAAQNNYRQN